MRDELNEWLARYDALLAQTVPSVHKAPKSEKEYKCANHGGIVPERPGY